MTISARAHYACLAMVELAIRQNEGSVVTIREITDRHDIPGPFLVQILRTLRSAGWVESTRGSQGGYRLGVDPETISVLEIAEMVGCQESGCRTDAAPTPAGELLQEIWAEAAEASRSVLAATRLSDLVERSRHGQETMFYI
ncbi:HTH-type transcriptional regulator CymR [Rubripirellula amarantea]|uniref:HTH-type transcriptional regulator CymR n=1 Tax=Rubripirellula amarantea TaxID=2527999 RepID=A0A5C5WLQ6_9BACT|nr:Rrf2 family transcriptional regulator [Rubripirellula amarantea]TWT50712.1 HTH-type transcriptional regulator CymR [Rubripirellula amarantea]